MKITVERAALVPAAKAAAAAAKPKSTSVQLGWVRLTVKGKSLTLEATDLEIGRRISLPCKGKGEPVAVDAKLFAQATEKLSGEEVRLELDGERLLITDGRAEIRLALARAEECPALPNAPDKGVSLDAAGLARIIGYVEHAVATAEGLYNLSTVCLQKSEAGVAVVATDGHRLGVWEGELEGLANLVGKGCLLPRQAIKPLLQLCKADETVELGFSKGACLAAQANDHLCVALVESRYPDWRQVVPGGEDLSQVTVKRLDLQAAVGRVGLLTAKNLTGVKLELSKDRLTLSMDNPNLGQTKDWVEADWPTDDPVVMGFNAKYLADALKHLTSDEVTLAWVEPGKPVRITGPADEGVAQIVMPMQV